jgi:hypothetical protein
MLQQLDGPTEVTNFISDLNNKYEKVGQQSPTAAAVCEVEMMLYATSSFQ